MKKEIHIKAISTLVEDMKNHNWIFKYSPSLRTKFACYILRDKEKIFNLDSEGYVDIDSWFSFNFQGYEYDLNVYDDGKQIFATLYPVVNKRTCTDVFVKLKVEKM